MARTIIVMLGLLLAAGVGVGCGGAESADGVAVTYRAVPLERGPATRQMVDRAVAIVRRRLATLDARHATASRSGAMIRVTVAAADKKTLTEGDVTAVGRLAFYD